MNYKTENNHFYVFLHLQRDKQTMRQSQRAHFAKGGLEVMNCVLVSK